MDPNSVAKAGPCLTASGRAGSGFFFSPAPGGENILGSIIGKGIFCVRVGRYCSMRAGKAWDELSQVDNLPNPLPLPPTPAV